MTVLLTGASGFIGSATLNQLTSLGYTVRPAVRSLHSIVSSQMALPPVPIDFNYGSDCSLALAGITDVIHLAARVHVMKEPTVDALGTYRNVNVAGTLALARQAAQAGVRRFIFVSSVKVNGERTLPGKPFTPDAHPEPREPYGISKLEAEVGLREIEAQTGMEVVIIRPPLVYGPGVKANFGIMMRWVASGAPLPFGAIRNARSMVALDNLVDFLITCLAHPAAAGQTFLVSDDEDVSTTELLRKTAQVMGRRALLLPVPSLALEIGAALLGRQAEAHRLLDSLQVDIEKSRRLLGWSPPLTLDQGLTRAVKGLKK